MADKQFKVRTPDGKTITVTAPENATDDQIESLAKDQYYKGSERPRVDLAPKPDQIRILQNEYRDAVARLTEARKRNDQAAMERAESDRVAVASELQRLGPSLIPGAEPTPQPAQAPQPPQAAPGQSMVSAAREMMPSMDSGRLMADVGAMGAGAAGAQVMDRTSVPGGPTRTGTPVQKWAGAMGYSDRGGRTYGEAHQMEQGLRKGARIGGVQPEFRFAKPPAMEPSLMQRAGQTLMSSPKTAGALGGLGAAESGMEAMRRMQQGDAVGAAISGAGALGGVASASPFLPARALGAGVGIASPLALYLYDKMRNTSPQTAQQMLSNVDLMGNPMP